MDLYYEQLSKELTDIIRSEQDKGLSEFAFRDENAVRRKDLPNDYPNIIRSNFIKDADKILNCPYFNRYADKTQVFALQKNDDLSRRMLHVQLVSRIARTIGKALRLNLELIEAIALGHDIGHPPFAHTGEKYLNELYFSRTGRYFSHNIHSVRVLDGIFTYNVTLQTLDGIACHDGETEMPRYEPTGNTDFAVFDSMIEGCYTDRENRKKLMPATLEGCVVRIADLIAYLGKDRQDAQRAKLAKETDYSPSAIGTVNAEIINNLVVNVIENSYGKPYIEIDHRHFDALRDIKAENYKVIYNSVPQNEQMKEHIKPMMANMYEKILYDLEKKDKESPVYNYHINYINKSHYAREKKYVYEDKNDITVDFIASMTDDYFIDLFNHMFPSNSHNISYRGYFH